MACILLFGKYPQKFFPRGRTRFIRYKGTEERVGAEMNVIKDVTFEGTILDLVKAMIAYLETQVEEHTFLGQHGQFVTHRDYPKFVIQEMVVNACCHRAYNIKGTEIQIKMFDNRLVFESPGRLPGTVKPSNIRHTHFSRNPKIAQFLKAYDYVVLPYKPNISLIHSILYNKLFAYICKFLYLYNIILADIYA